MGQKFQTKQARVPVIRKIFRKGKVFTCGICRSNYHSRGEANHCLNECWFQLRHHYPLIHEKHHGQPIKYKCQFCYRIYTDQEEALDCAQLCMEAHEQKHLSEQLTNDLPISVKSRRKFKLIRVNSSGIKSDGESAEPPLVKIVKPDPSVSTPSVENDVKVEEKPEKTKEETAKPDDRRHISFYEKSWIREGAKYKCCYCGTLHYTRIEVEPCFNGHFDKDGLEKEEGGHIKI